MISLLFESNGRISRSRFWLGVVILVPLFLVCQAAILVLFSTALSEMLSLWILFQLGSFLLFMWMSFSLNAKRWHDMNKSGKWNLLLFIPVVGPVWMLLELGFIPGTQGPNQYGDQP